MPLHLLLQEVFECYWRLVYLRTSQIGKGARRIRERGHEVRLALDRGVQ